MGVYTDVAGPGEGQEAHWYALYAKHHHERKVAEALQRKGVEVFLPLYEAERQWKDRKKKLMAPLFPGYIFIRSDLRDRVGILSTSGVFFLVELAGRACAIPDAEIEAVRTVVRSAMRCEPFPYLESGEPIRVRTGPLAGLEGFYVRAKSNHRVVISVELLKKSIAVEMDLDHLAKAAG